MAAAPETKSTFRFRKRNVMFLCTSFVCLGTLLNYLKNPGKYKSLHSGSEAMDSQLASNASYSHELQNNAGVRGGVVAVASGENVHNSPLLDNNGSISIRVESYVAINTSEPKVEMAPADAVTKTHNESHSDKFLNNSDPNTTTNDSKSIEPSTSTDEQNKTSLFITKNGINCDEIGDCRGFFAYSGPNNHAPNATAITHEVASTYNYGPEKNTDGHLIFFPNKTNSQACIEEWKSAKFGGRGMSAWREDITIYEAFFKSRNSSNNSPGFYMEIGAHDGVRESNSRFFDLCLGWNGLLVEPHPMNYAKMEKLRPNALHLGLAPSCNTSDIVKFPRHQYTNANVFDPRGSIEIHCGPLSYYLEQLHISHIDFWSLDVEGSEINILRTVDFTKVQIDVIMAESVNSQKGKGELAQVVRSYLVQQHDYLLLNSVNVHKSDVFLHKRACLTYNNIPECNSFPPAEQNKTSLFITKNGINCDEIGDCRGFFAYSGPNNHALNATAITHEVASTYNYGPEKNTDGHLIFFPNKTNSQACIDEWKSAKFADRGMSAWSEDITIYEAFFKSRNSSNSSPGFYMEIGAHDGVRESNSRFFDLCLGWNGLLVEPHPINYATMEKLRPNALHLGLAPSCNTSDVVKFARHQYTNANVFDPQGTIEIHCGPLSYYLEQLHISHIDFWSLDVEGSEINILRTVDFTKVQIDVIMAESVNSQKGKGELAQVVRSYLVQQHDYLLLNSVNVYKSDVFLHKRACHRYNNIPECHTFQVGNATEGKLA